MKSDLDRILILLDMLGSEKGELQLNIVSGSEICAEIMDLYDLTLAWLVHDQDDIDVYLICFLHAPRRY